MRRTLLTLATALALITALPALAQAADTFSVDTEADNAAPGACAVAPGDCSIRQAIALAQDGDTVAISAGHYLLDPQQGVLAIDRDITIQGTGNPVIDGGDATGVFLVQPQPTVTVDGITVTGGHDTNNGGGGFAVYGDLILTNSTVSGNRTDRSGGGIGVLITEAPPGSLRLENSTVSNNKAGGDGGGIANINGSATIVQSTIVGNEAGAPGDQLDHFGGGILSDNFFGDASLAIYNSTITGNSASGTNGEGGNIYLADQQIAAFVAVQAAAAGLGQLQNTIVAEGTASAGPNCGGVTPTSLGQNAVPTGQCGQNPALGDVTGDPKLGPLGDNGGTTLTRKLLPGSAAINAGDPTGCKDDNLAAITPDQRALARPQGSACDIGAVEFGPPAAVTTDPASVTAASATINGNVSNPLPTAGTTHFEFGTSTAYGQTIPLGTLAGGASSDPRSSGVTGLSPNTTYHYRIVAQNADDSAVGADKQFTTPVSVTPEPEPTPEPVPEPNTPNAPNPKKPTVRAARASGGCVRTRFSARLSVHVASSAKLRSVLVSVDGKRVMKTTRKRFSVHINARRLHAGSHVLRVVATDSNGRKTTLKRLFRRCRPQTQPAFTG